MPASTAKVVPMTAKLSNGERDLAARHGRTPPHLAPVQEEINLHAPLHSAKARRLSFHFPSA